MSAHTSPADNPSPNAKATVKKKMHFSPIWLIPIGVLLVVMYVAYDAIKKHGRTITLSFASADGLVPGETPIRHKNVRLGTVEDVHLSDDLSHVEVKVRVDLHESKLLTDHARFWVVRPRLNGSISNLTSGLETLVSGAYIAVDPGLPGGHEKHDFVGLEEPPGIRSDEPGSVFVLQAKKLGSLSTGSPIYFHETIVGEVLKADVGDGRSDVHLRIFVRAPFDKFVAPQTQFWNVSGLSVSMGPEGLHLELQSLQAVLTGGIAFESPPSQRSANEPVPDETLFPLYDDKASADAAAFSLRIPCVTYFKSTVQGLAVGAPVQMLGSTVGTVRTIKIEPNPSKLGGWLARVGFEVQPERIAGNKNSTMTSEALRGHPPRVYLDSVSLITGQKVISLDFASGHEPKPGEVSMEGDSVVLPGESGGIENITVAMGHIAGKIEQIPFDDIGKSLDATLKSVQNIVASPDLNNAIHELSGTIADAHKLVKEADQGIGPALARIPAMADQMQQALTNANHAFGQSGFGADSDFQRNVSRLMKQVNEAMRSIRLLADFLDKHPEALIRGRTSGASEK